MGSVIDADWRPPRTGARRGSRSPAHARGSPFWVCCRCCVNAMFGWLPGRQPQMGPAPANPTARRDGHAGAPNPLLGRWFGCPGAGPICACHRNCAPGTVLTNECQFANRLGRERGPENGYPDRRPRQGLSDQWQRKKPSGSAFVAPSHRLQRHRFDA